MFWLCFAWYVGFFFFFQAEDGIRDVAVTGVQTCALPIYTAALLMLYSVVVMLACRALHLYIRPRRSGMLADLATITQAVVLASAVVLGYLAIEERVPRMVVVLCAGGLDLALLLGWRAVRMKI